MFGGAFGGVRACGLARAAAGSQCAAAAVSGGGTVQPERGKVTSARVACAP